MTRYWVGFASGVCVFAAALLAYVNLQVIPMHVDLYAELEPASLPSATRFAASPAWHWGALAVSLFGLFALNKARITSESRRATALAVITVFAAAALWFTWWAMRLPINELADDINAF